MQAVRPSFVIDDAIDSADSGWQRQRTTTLRLDVYQHERRIEQHLHAQMDTILNTIGFSKGTVAERMRALAKDPRYQFADSDTGRAEIMAFIENRHRPSRSCSIGKGVDGHR